jgi:rhodanese-related sulfurtransferase
MLEIRNEPVFITGYQLQNLQRNRVGFLFLDLSEKPVRAELHSKVDAEMVDQLLIGKHSVKASEVLDFLKTQTAKSDSPVVLICETGAISIAVARVLQENSFINVFVIEGGVEGLLSNDF